MKILRVYLDTSVIGGCLDEEFSEWSNLLWKEFQSGMKKAVLSDLTLQELDDAPDEVREVVARLPSGLIDYVFLTPEAMTLAETYLAHGIVTERHLLDAQHIAIATIERVDVLVSWNFKQIVNLERIKKFNAVNLLQGYPQIEIRSPVEVLHGEDN